MYIIIQYTLILQTVTLEPGVVVGQLTNILIPRGYILLVVPEIDALSIGGLIAGAGVESSSHRFGLIHETATEYKVALANGQVVTCSRVRFCHDLQYVCW